MKNLLPKTASQRAIAGLTSLALVAGGLTVMPYAGAQNEEQVVTGVEAAPGAEPETNGLPETPVNDDLIANALETAEPLNAAQQTPPLPADKKAIGFFNEGMDPSAGSTVDFHASKLPAGARITSVGAGGVNWLTKEQIYDAFANDDGEAVINDVQVPADAKTGDQIYFTYLGKDAAGVEKELEVQAAAKVASSTEPINVDKYTGAKRTLLSDLHESAFDPNSKNLFVTRTSEDENGNEKYTIYKLDAKTLDVLAKNDLEENYAANGIAVDNKGQVWVTNSDMSTVSVYKQSDLTHIKTFGVPLNSPEGIIIDNKNNLAYVSGQGGQIVVLDINQENPIGTIELDGFEDVASLSYDEQTNQLIATSGVSDKLQVAKVDLAHGKKVDRYEVKGDRGVFGAAYDPVSKNIFVATGESVVTVINSETGKVVTTIDTGAKALDVRYNPKDKRVYVVNSEAGTLSVIDPVTNKAVAKLDVGKDPVHVSVASDGTVAVVNQAEKNIGQADAVDEVYTFKYNAPTPPPQPKPSTTESTTSKPTEKPKPSETTKPNPPTGSNDLSSKLGKYRNILIAIFSVLGLTGIIAGAVAAMAHANMIPKEWLPQQFR